MEGDAFGVISCIWDCYAVFRLGNANFRVLCFTRVCKRLSDWTRLVYFSKEKSCMLKIHSVLANFPLVYLAKVNVVITKSWKGSRGSVCKRGSIGQWTSLGEMGSGVLAICSGAFT